MNLFQLLPLIIAFIPGAVQAVEIASDSSVAGADKKKAVLDAVTQAAAVAAEVDPGDAKLISFVANLASPFIDSLVAFYRLIGRFTKKPAQAAAAAK